MEVDIDKKSDKEKEDILISRWDGKKIIGTIRASDSDTGYILINADRLEVSMNYMPKGLIEQGGK